MLKKISLSLALFWAAIILYFCLIRISELPEINILYVDKMLHAFFYFVFSVLWFYALRFYFKKQRGLTLFKIVFLMSLFFGIAIELFQTFFTTYRSGDVVDVLANTTGTILALMMIRFLDEKGFSPRL